jgi:hypothetical protein
MDEELVTLQISAPYREKLRALAGQDIRSMKGEFEWIIDQEIARRAENARIAESLKTLKPTVSMETAKEID